MARRMQQQEEASAGNEWMNTYCDMVTLLFTFFVLLFAISQVDVQKWNLLAASLSSRGVMPEQIMDLGLQNEEDFDVDDPRIPLPEGPEDLKPTLADVHADITAHIEESGMEGKVTTVLGDDYIFIRFVDDMLFEPNSARIRQQDFELLSFIGMSLKSVENEVGMIRIDGHTAAVPEQEDYHVSDRDLSSDRANAVLKYLEDIVGLRGDKLTALAFGKHLPIGDNYTEEGRRINRRIELFITEADALTGQLDSIYEKMYH